MKIVYSFAKPIINFFFLWFILFTIQRLIFFVSHYNEIPLSIGFFSRGLVFVYSIRLDLATIAFLAAPYIILKSIYNSFEKKWLQWTLKIIVCFEIVLVSAIHCGEVIAYYEWGHKLTSRVFMHLSSPDEVARTAEASSILFFFLLLAIELLTAFFVLKKLKLFSNLPHAHLKNGLIQTLRSSSAIILSLSICVLLARGGVQQIPINIDSAYFSEHQIMNDISVNSAYFFGNSFVLYNKSDVADHLPKISDKDAKATMNILYSYDRNHRNNFLAVPKPNIILIVLEGWSANAMGCLNSSVSATPNFDNLARSGVLFTNVYATNTTSEIGNTSIFAGYPSLPETPISLYPEKHRNLPTINEKLKKQGYSTNYLFSGDLKYGNIKGFLMGHGFDKLKDENDFPSGLARGKLNYYDKDLYALLLNDINATKAPFLHCVFTGSTHSPYDYPLAKTQAFKGEESKYLNSMVYADKCLAEFMQNCKAQKWFKNTIFVIISDHGHATPGINSPFETAFFKIPFLIVGEPIAKEHRGTKIETLGSQADLAATLLHQLGLPSEDFVFSKDLLSPNVKDFAFYSTIRGYGFVTPKGSIRYNFDARKIALNNIKVKTDFTEAKNQSEACFYSFFKHFQELDNH